MNTIDKDGYETYQLIKVLKTASNEEVFMMEQFTKKYIDAKCTICRTCPAQIRFAFNRIINWAKKIQIETLSFEEIIDETITEEINYCECGNVLTDKRRKVCKECKKKNK